MDSYKIFLRGQNPLHTSRALYSFETPCALSSSDDNQDISVVMEMYNIATTFIEQYNEDSYDSGCVIMLLDIVWMRTYNLAFIQHI